MKENSRRIVLLVMIAGTALAVAACKTVTGGGWISLENGSRANFGLQMMCEDGDGDPSTLFDGIVSGNIQYSDHSADVSFHGVADTVPFHTCGGFIDSFGCY